jgi:D-arabinose 1-dehydrogenase-like Zn-dependent alcohol dehydrogenase
MTDRSLKHTVWTGIERAEIPTTEPIGIIGIGGLG